MARRRSPSSGTAASAISMGLRVCISAITPTFSVTMPTWKAESVTPLIRAPAIARWCQRPRSDSRGRLPLRAAAIPRIAVAAISRTPTKSSGEITRRPTRAVTNEELHSRMKT